MPNDMTPAEAAAQLRHVADLFCTPTIKQAALMGAEALETLAATEEPTDRKEQAQCRAR